MQTFENVKAGQTLTATEPAIDDPPANCLRCWRCPRRVRRSARASPRAASGRSRAASRPAVRSRRASPTSRNRPGSPSRLIYGGADTKNYIIEVVGLRRRVLRLRQRRLARSARAERHASRGRPPGTTNRLYKNNRDGTFTDVTAKAGLTRSGWASAVTVGDYDNDGFDDLFITVLRPATSCITTTATAPSPTSPRRRACGRTTCATARAAPGWTTIATAVSICSSQRT